MESESSNLVVDHDELAVEHVTLAVARDEGTLQALHDVIVHAVYGLPVAREESHIWLLLGPGGHDVRLYSVPVPLTLDDHAHPIRDRNGSGGWHERHGGDRES